MKQRGRLPVVTAESIDCRPYRFRVDISHELADELFLAAKRATRPHRLRRKHRVEKSLLQLERVELRALQADQFFAKRLQREMLALACRLAGPGVR